MAKYNQKSAATLNYEAIYLTSNANDKVFLNCSTCKTEPAWFWKWKEFFMSHPTIYKICISQNTTILRQQSLCVWKCNILQSRIRHSQAHNNSNNTQWGKKM